MNAEKLNKIVTELKLELHNYEIINSLTEIKDNLGNIINQPNQPAYQQNLTTELNKLSENLSKVPSNSFSPAWKQIIIEIGGEELLGIELKDTIEDIFAKNQITPSAALEKISELLTKLEDFTSAIDNLVEGFKGLDIGKEELQPGECEIGYSVPRKFVDSKLRSFADEVREFNFILSNISEVITGDKEEFEIRTISSSDFLIYVASGIWMTEVFAKVIERILNSYKSILEIKKIRNDLKAQGVPEEKTKGIEEYANSLMEKEIKKLTKEVIKEHYKGKDPGRKNELANGLTISFNKLANRIDKGFNVEVRVEPLPKPKEEPEEGLGKDEQVKINIINSILEKQKTLEFLQTSGESILQLEEKNTKK